MMFLIIKTISEGSEGKNTFKVGSFSMFRNHVCLEGKMQKLPFRSNDLCLFLYNLIAPSNIQLRVMVLCILNRFSDRKCNT